MKFMEGFRSFLQSGVVKRHVIEVHVPTVTVLDYATTLAQRRQLLESFFHTAFDQVRSREISICPNGSATVAAVLGPACQASSAESRAQ